MGYADGSLPMARLEFAVPAAAALMLLALPAGAQTITVNTAQSFRTDSAGTRQQVRGTQYNPEGINRSDCLGPDDKGLTINYSLTIAGLTTTNLALRVFASVGQDCVALTQRSGQNPQCWAVTGSVMPLVQQTVAVRAQDVVSQVDQGMKVVEPPPATVAACNGKSEGIFDVTLYFLLLQPGGEAAGTGAKLGVKAKVTGPPAPTGLTASAGPGLLTLNFTPQRSNSLVGYQVFVADTSGLLTDAGTIPTSDASQGTDAAATMDADVDAGTDADVDAAADDAATQVDSGSGSTTDSGSSSGGTCPGSLVEGKTPDGLPPYTTTGSTGATITVKGLENGRTYSVAMAGQDSFLNVGPLSNVACAAPIDVVDFFDAYRAAGGQAGGGYCNTGGVGLGGSAGLGAAAALFGLALVRRRRGRS